MRQLPHDCQAQPETAGHRVRCTLDAVERPEDGVQLILRNRRSAVEHADAQVHRLARRLRHGLADQLDRPRGIAQRVAEQVVENARQHVGRRDGTQVPRATHDQRCTGGVGGGAMHLRARLQPRTQVEDLTGFRAQASCDLQQLPDQAVHLLDVELEPHKQSRFGLEGQHLQREPHARQRRAQVVREAGKQRRSSIAEFTHLKRHAVEMVRQGSQLARPGFRQQVGVRAFRELGGRQLETFHRLRDPARQPPGQGADEQHAGCQGGRDDGEWVGLQTTDRKAHADRSATGRYGDPEPVAAIGGDLPHEEGLLSEPAPEGEFEETDVQAVAQPGIGRRQHARAQRDLVAAGEFSLEQRTRLGRQFGPGLRRQNDQSGQVVCRSFGQRQHDEPQHGGRDDQFEGDEQCGQPAHVQAGQPAAAGGLLHQVAAPRGWNR